MGIIIARKIKGMSLRTKISIIFMLVMASFLYQAVLKPLIGDTATNTYYFGTASAVSVGVDGSTSTRPSLAGRLAMSVGVYTTSRSVASTAAANTEQVMIKAYSPAYTTNQTVTAPAVTIGVRDSNGTTNSMFWKAYVYDYNPAVASNITNATLATKPALWVSNEREAHPSVQTPLELTFTTPLPKEIVSGHRLIVVITCKRASTASSPRFYWGGSTNYSFFTVTEALTVANSVTVTDLKDYYNNQLTTVTQGDSNIPMLQFSLYSNVAGGASWTGGKLDKIGTNTSIWLNADEPGDVSFSIYKDTDNDGVFESTDPRVGGPYNFNQLIGQTYTLDTAQTIDTTLKRYFITYNIQKNSTYSTTVGARIPTEAISTYFAVTGAVNGVRNVTGTSSSTPNIQYGGAAVTKNYPADWDNGTSLAGISETGATQPSPNATDSDCLVRNTTGAGFPLVGLLNYPVHSCTSVAGQGYSTTTAQTDFARLYFNKSGYHSVMKSVKGGFLVYRVITPSGGGTVTLRLFYVTSGGVRVNAPIASTYKTTSTLSQTITTSLAGQDFNDVPLGARLGIQIGVTANMRIGLGRANGATGSTNGAYLSVVETTAENENIDVGDGIPIANANVYASDTAKISNSFTLSASKAKTVNSITVTGSAMFNSTNVKKVWIYEDVRTVGTLGKLDATDTLVGSTTTISGTSATISTGSLAVSTAVKRYLVVVDIGDAPSTNTILTALVSDLTVATSGGIGDNSDATSATLTILPTTTLSNGTAEPANQIIPSGSAATKVDAFALKTNGGINDNISNLTVTLTTSTPGSLPAGKVISDYIARIDILNGAGVSIGHLTSVTQVNNWQVSTPGLAATTTATDYYVAITPKTNQNITLKVSGTVTAIAHSRTTNKLILSDSGSATITMDQQPPTEPVLTAVTGTYGADIDLAQINLSWIGSTDASTGDNSLVSYILVRGLANAPAPRSCTVDNVKTFLVYGPGTNLSFTNKELEEGSSYGYRLCAKDSVGNINFGVTAATTSSIKTRCGELPKLEISPIANYLTPGNSVAMAVNITNMNTGVCAATTFTLAIVGTDIDDTNFTTSSFTANNFVIATNKDSAATKLNITAKPGAAQGAIKTFNVKVTKSSGGETQYPDPVYVTVNSYGTMIHSSMNLGTAKYGSWGTSYDCATCHSPDSGNIKQVKDAISTPTGSRQVTFSITSAARGASVAGVFGNDNRSGTASTNVCEVCHHKVRFHQYSTSKIAWTAHNNNSDCMICHPHSKGFKTVSLAGSCSDCHGNPPTNQANLVFPATNVLPANTTNAGSHEKHEARQVKCGACHSNGNHLVSAIPDAKLNIGFNINGTTFTGFVGNTTSGRLDTLPISSSYTWVSAAGTTITAEPGTIMSCNVYCHGWSGDGGYNSEPAWTGIYQVGCGSCHAANGNDPPTSGSHHKHASTEAGYGNGIACRKCHGFRNYTTSSAHINGNVEWDLSTLPGLALYRGLDKGSTGKKAPTAPGNYGTCTNLYCHSDIQSANGAGPALNFSPVTWGGTTNCGSCHAEPNTSGGHTQHVGAGVTGFGCQICHYSGGDSTPLNHADDKIDFSFVGLGENTHYSYSSSKIPGSGTYGTCYSSNCHGRKTLPWTAATATPLCDKCHSTNSFSTGFYGTAGPGSTTAKTDPYVGAHFLHLTSMAGKKYSAKISCEECHLNPDGPYTPGHVDTALPAEITYGDLANSGVQNGYTSAGHTPGYNSGSKVCSNVWCHGAGMNSNEGIGPYGSAVYDGATLHVVAPVVWNVPFLTGVGTNDCDKCHAFPPPAQPGYMHWDDKNNRPYIANECILCHNHLDNTGYKFKKPELHVDGIVDSCYTCHGRPPNDEAGLTIPAIGAVTLGFAGAHQSHAINPNIGKDCYVCHANYSDEMPSYRMEIGFKAYSGRVSTGTFYGYSTLSANYSPLIVYASSAAGTIVRRTTDIAKLNTCENVYCHGAGTATLPALSGGTNIKPNWEGGISQAECGSCHGVSSETYKSTGSHGVHVGTAYGDPHISCANCHGIKENNYHVDGKVEWDFYSTTKRLNLLVTNPKYTPAGGNGTAGTSGKTNNLAPSATFGTCQVYCHSDGHGNYANPLPVWGGAPMNCGSCHINQTSTFDGSHQNHSGGVYNIDCLVCHYGSGMGSNNHINGAIDIILNPAIAGPTAVYNSATKTCFNILCHISDATHGPTWNVPSTGAYVGGTYKPTCIGCHTGELNGRAAVVPQFVGESHHVQGTTISNTVCYQCHWEGNADGTANTTYHDRLAAKPVNLVIWNATTRPAVYTEGTTGTAYTDDGTRAQLLKINSHCLKCHNAANAAITPFGDGKNPEKYSWDGFSIDERYTQATTTLWGKVVGNNTAVKNTVASNTKAYSAHGRADLNKRGWAVGNGTTGETYAADTSGAINVLCYDCHNSHGTASSGIMSSYSSATGRYKGGMLKSTTAGIGGYNANYTPSAGGSAAAPDNNAYNPGAALCFNCHNNKTADADTPWGYNSTFGSSQAIYGYNDKPYFGNYSTFANTVTYGYKKNNSDNKGGHFGHSSDLTTSVAKPINGLCTPCHDPHGVSPTLGANQQYGVPLLKGTWVTSPYKQDAAPASATEARGGSTKGSAPRAIAVGSTPGYNIDQNSMGVASGAPRASWTFPGTPSTLQPKTDVEFAGLCTGCHAKAAINNTAAATSSNWKSMSRVHNSVDGWATATGGNANNSKHAFTCSKCHTAHNAKLPRLLVTNCLDVKHRGRVASGGSMPAVQNQSGNKGKGAGRFPQGGGGTGSLTLSSAGKWFFGKGVQSTVIATQSQTLCHESGTAGGAYNAGEEQKWNNRSLW